MARAAYRERDAAACMVSVVIRLDEDTHEEIRARAKKEEQPLLGYSARPRRRPLLLIAPPPPGAQ